MKVLGRKFALVVLVLLIAAGAAIAVFVMGDSGGSHNKPQNTDVSIPLASGAPEYCKQLTTLPAGLEPAVNDAVLGDTSSDEKQVIAQVAAQLRKAAGDSAVSAETRSILNTAAMFLDKLANGQQLSDADATSFNATFQSLGKVVDETCSVK